MFFFGGGGARAVLFRQTPIASVALFPMLHHKDSDNIDNFPTDLNNRGGGMHGPLATAPLYKSHAKFRKPTFQRKYLHDYLHL